MSERSEYAPGEFCWVDLATTDVDGAIKFYGELLGDRGRGRRPAIPRRPAATGSSPRTAR